MVSRRGCISAVQLGADKLFENLNVPKRLRKLIKDVDVSDVREFALGPDGKWYFEYYDKKRHFQVGMAELVLLTDPAMLMIHCQLIRTITWRELTGSRTATSITSNMAKASAFGALKRGS